jgi:hypothetical protein
MVCDVPPGKSKRYSSLRFPSQYFLITPKLLPNLQPLEFSAGSPAITILFVFNGPFSFKSSTEWADYMRSLRGGRGRSIEAITDEENDENDNGPRRTSNKKSHCSK